MHVPMILVTCQFLHNVIGFVSSNHLVSLYRNILEHNEHTDNELGYCVVRLAHVAHNCKHCLQALMSEEGAHCTRP